MPRVSGERNCLSDVLEASAQHDHSLESQAESAVWMAPISAEIHVPPVVLRVQSQFGHLRLEHLKAILSGRSSYDLSNLLPSITRTMDKFGLIWFLDVYLREQDVHGLDCFPVFVGLHVEGLDLGWVVV